MSNFLCIPHPRRILLLGQPKSGKLTFLRALTGTLPPFQRTDAEASYGNENDKTPHAGLSHSYKIKTSYYEAEIPIWVDEWEAHAQGRPSSEGLQSWTKQYLSLEAREVIQALGGVIVCFREATTIDEIETVKLTLSSVQEILDKHTYGFDGVTLAISTPCDGIRNRPPSASTPNSSSNQSHPFMSTGNWEDLARQFGFEFIDFSSACRNEYGELMGMERVREALESNDWSLDNGAVTSGDPEEDTDENEPDLKGGRGFKFEVAELESEMMGLSEEVNAMAVEREEKGQENERKEGSYDEKQVEELEELMLRMATLKELGDDEASRKERRRLAAQFLSSIMKEHDEGLTSNNNNNTKLNENKSSS